MMKKNRPFFKLTGAITIAAVTMFPPAALSAELLIYADALATGWQDWSWDITPNFANPTPTHNGHASIAVTYTTGWGGLLLGHSAPLDANGMDTLRFWIHGGSTGGQSVEASVCDPNKSCVPANTVIHPQANTWTEINVPLTGLGNVIYSIQFFNNTSGSQSPFYLDDITLVGQGTPPQPGVGPALSVDAKANRHPISPYIYGMNFADEALAAELRLPVRRWGGNSTTRYNWQNDTHNTGSDWYFENIPNDNPNPAALPNGSTADRFVEQDRRTGTKTLMTVPLLGWTPKRRLATHPYDCGFNTTRYGAQQSTDPWDPPCGNGIRSTGAAITGNDPGDTSVAITPDFVKDWIVHLIGNYSTATAGGVLFYNLDNEPMLWDSTHRDVHPQPTSYDELRDRTYAYAAAIKATDPTALTVGPAVWGWCAYFYSAVDNCSSDGADYQAHGSIPFVAWYLQQMRAYEQQQGVRILNYLDLHNYPQASGVYSDSAGDSATQALRLRSTRSLWDPGYTDESWIGEPIFLIPRMRQWVATHYPGTKLAVTEYSWGAQGHLNGALAQADILGIFGREGLDLATLWGPPTSLQPGAMAFRIYRNYDGSGGSFGEVSVHAASADQDQLAIYAAEKNQTLTLVIINKTLTDLTSEVSLAGFTPAGTAQVYRYSAANLNAIVPAPAQTLSASGFSATFPALSITLVVAPVSSSADDPLIFSGDYNGDGRADLIWRHETTGQVYGMLLEGYSIAQQGMVYTESNTAWRIVSNGDFNGDGRDELLWWNGQTGQVYQMPMNGLNIAGGTQIYQEPNTAWQIVAVGDLSGDSKEDLIWWNNSSGQVYGMVMNGSGIAQGGMIYQEANTAWRILAARDFNADGKADLLWRNTTTGQVYLMPMNGLSIAGGALVYHEPNLAWSITAVGDLNGDRKADLVWWNHQTGQVYGMLMDGPGITQEAMLYQEPNTAWQIIASGDYTGDGKADLLWRNGTTGQVYEMVMSGLSIVGGAQIYQEANPNWRILATAADIPHLPAPGADSAPLTGNKPINAYQSFEGALSNPSPSLSGVPLNSGVLPATE